MQIALICTRGGNKSALPPDFGMSAQEEKLEADQTLAIALRMRDGGRLMPLLICDAGSSLAEEARQMSLPHLAINGSPLAMFRLWRWQRRQEELPVLAIGGDAMRLAGRLRRMRRGKKTVLAFAFFLSSPPLIGANLKMLGQARICFHGSQYVKEKLAGACPEDVFIACPPGIDLDVYRTAAKCDGFNADRHFRFGMANSLMPRSGALLVIRAMAAIWQKRELPPWETRMFGAGPRFGEILREAEDMGVASRLSILSDQPLPLVSPHCDAWIAPGSSMTEFPQDLWAGYAAGLPVISVQSQLHRERILSPNAALRIETNNPQELARAMIAIMRDDKLRDRLVSRGANVRPHAGLRAMADKICLCMENIAPRK